MFFEFQRIRKRQVALFIFLFLAALIGCHLVFYYAIFWVLTWVNGFKSLDLTPSYLFIYSGLFYYILVFGGILHMRFYIASTGSKLLENMGARRLHGQTKKSRERMLKNVVEEMAIASGILCPRIYIFDLPSINAMTAGYRRNDCAIAFTQGAIDLLTRDELQVLAAHEFGHVLNGDTALQMKIMGTLNGLNAFVYTGKLVCSRRSVFRFTRKGGLGIALFLAGILCIVVGSVGTFCARMIKYAMLKQKEYLADAYAVQFTRNPYALTSLLKKVGGYRWGSHMKVFLKEETCQLFFANAFDKNMFGHIFSSHPPLDQRILVYEPSFDGKYTELKREETMPDVPSLVAQTRGRTSIHELRDMFSKKDLSEKGLSNLMLWTQAFDLEEAQQMRSVSDQDAFGKTDASPEKPAWDLMARFIPPQMSLPAFKETLADTLFRDHLDEIWQQRNPEHPYSPLETLGLIEISRIELSEVSTRFKRELLRVAQRLTDWDQKLHFTEFFLLSALKMALLGSDPLVATHAIPQSEQKAQVYLLYCLSHMTRMPSAHKKKAFYRHAVDIYRYAHYEKLRFSIQLLENAIHQCQHLSEPARLRLLDKMLGIVTDDQNINAAEMLWIRAMGILLDIPVPLHYKGVSKAS